MKTVCNGFVAINYHSIKLWEMATWRGQLVCTFSIGFGNPIICPRGFFSIILFIELKNLWDSFGSFFLLMIRSRFDGMVTVGMSSQFYQDSLEIWVAVDHAILWQFSRILSRFTIGIWRLGSATSQFRKHRNLAEEFDEWPCHDFSELVWIVLIGFGNRSIPEIH